MLKDFYVLLICVAKISLNISPNYLGKKIPRKKIPRKKGWGDLADSKVAIV